MDRRDSSKYQTASGSKPPSNSRSHGQPPPFPQAWSPVDQRVSRLQTNMQSSPPPPPPPKSYSNHQFTAMPTPSHAQGPKWLPLPPGPQTHAGYFTYGYPTQPANGSQPEVWQFPEPQIMRSTSHKSSLHPSSLYPSSLYPPPGPSRPRAHSSTGMHPTLETSTSTPNLKHKYSHSDSHGAQAWNVGENADPFERSPSIAPSILSEEFTQITLGGPAADGLASADGLKRFQYGEGDDGDWAWHLLVTKEARESLPPAEVMRQSAIFDMINGERSYVSDMVLVQEVFINGLRQAKPPVLPSERLDGFVNEVFWNMDRILSHHQRLLGSLYELQRDQHPILLSVGDIVLDTVLKFQPEYDSYIKHYPLAESLHRRELRTNPRYRAFLEKCSQDPRLGKRDLITFISRPVTRLPRLSLQLMEIKKRTEKLSEVDGVNSSSAKHDADLPDLETIPILVDVLNRFVKSTQPGIEASEGKVKFYALCESLRFKRDEIIDMDLYNENRTLVHSGPLARRQRSENWSGWTDLEVSLLDNYVLITKPDARTGRKDVVSRPIPLEYLRLGPFDGPPESRREERSEGGGLFDTIIKPTRPMFPLVISHASSPARRYTLYANSESARTKWRTVLSDALGVRKVVMDANKWFAVNSIDDGFFRMRTALVPGASTAPFTGKATAAVAFSSGGKNMVAVATPTGIFVGVRGQSNFSKVLALPSVTYLSALQDLNKLIILHNGALMAYSLDLIARVGQGQTAHQFLDASLERLAKAERGGTIIFFRVGNVAGRTLVVYATKSFMSSTLHVLEAGVNQSTNTLQRTQSQSRSSTFHPYGEPFYVPKEPFDVTLLAKMIAVSTDRLMTVIDPVNLIGQSPVLIPDFSSLPDNASPNSSPMAALKEKCDYAKPIGIVRSGKEELMVIYDEFGCYVTKHAVPTRKYGYVRWETKAFAYATRGLHLLLFSPQFLEIRHVPTGRLVQVLEGKDIRLMQSLVGSPLLIAMRGSKDDRQGMSDELAELVETAPFETTGLTQGRQETADTLWDEWD